ncbi:hypothetical protein AUP68_06774 [Ilyonectria robusta]
MASRVCAEKRVRVACIIQDRAFGRMGETADKVTFGEDGREVMNVDLSSPPGFEMSLGVMVTGNELNGGGYGRRSGGVIGLIRHRNRADVDDDYRRATSSASNHGCAWHFRFLASTGVQVAFLQPDNQQKPHHV